MRKIILYGDLSKRFGREHHFSVRNASEAVQAMCANYPGFRAYVGTAHKSGVGFKVFVGKNSLRRAEDAALPSAEDDTIRIAPALLGSGSWVRIIIGAALVYEGLAISAVPGYQLVGGLIASVGVSLLIGGVSELLSKSPNAPDLQDTGENGQSFIFGGPENVTRQGGGVPVGYGRMMVGSTVISASIEDRDQ